MKKPTLKKMLKLMVRCTCKHCRKPMSGYKGDDVCMECAGIEKLVKKAFNKSLKQLRDRGPL